MIFALNLRTLRPLRLCGRYSEFRLRLCRAGMFVVKASYRVLIMSFDAQAIFANLVEKERIKGHHSPEGRAIRTLSRALHGWSSASLSAGDVVVLCDQAIEDWLKARMKVSEWSTKNSNALLRMAAERELLTAAEADRLRQIHEMRSRSMTAAAADAESALQCSIQIVEERWE